MIEQHERPVRATDDRPTQDGVPPTEDTGLGISWIDDGGGDCHQDGAEEPFCVTLREAHDRDLHWEVGRYHLVESEFEDGYYEKHYFGSSGHETREQAIEVATRMAIEAESLEAGRATGATVRAASRQVRAAVESLKAIRAGRLVDGDVRLLNEATRRANEAIEALEAIETYRIGDEEVRHV
jgi:hypothetical protein